MSFRRPKIVIIGAGHTGATVALMVAQKQIGDIVLIDLPDFESAAKGRHRYSPSGTNRKI